MRSRYDWRALAARPRAEPIGAREPRTSGLGNSRGLTDLGELAKSRRPWAADSETSLSPDGGYSPMPPATARAPQDRPRIVPPACFPGTKAAPRARGSTARLFAHHDTERRRRRVHGQFDSSRRGALRRCHSGLTGTAGTAPPGRVASRPYSKRPRCVPRPAPARFVRETRRRMTRDQ